MCTLLAGHTMCGAQTGPTPATVVPGERLSDWVLRNYEVASTDVSALQWRASGQRAAQERLRQAVVANVPNEELSRWLQGLPLTGRVPLANADVRWLQIAPQDDPILRDGDSVVVPSRPRWVAVVSEIGIVCKVAHSAGRHAAEYLKACFGASTPALRDWAWVAQPDGRTARMGTAPWNAQSQDEPAPGAWLWAPSRSAAVAENVSDNLIRFLATQLPAEARPGEALLSVTPNDLSLARSSPPPADLRLTASDWGDIGLLQTPTARMAAVGAGRAHYANVQPYTRLNFMLQPFDWLEAGFRYTDISNRIYGPTVGSDQSLKDKSIDVKVRLLQEGLRWPELAVGVRDIGGTGLFAGEYLVASKRWGAWDASLGMGWGYAGGRHNLKNPLAGLDKNFDARSGNDNLNGGTVNAQNLFRGPTAMFGGVQWQAAGSPWLFKFELDGNDYQSEPDNNNQPSRTDFNFGAVYQYSPNLNLAVGFERGNRIMLGLTLHTDLRKLQSPKVLDPVLPAVQLNAGTTARQSAEQIAKAVAVYTGWTVERMSIDGGVITLAAQTDGAVMLDERVHRALVVLHSNAPAAVRTFVLFLQERGLPLSRLTIDRNEWVRQNTQAEAPALRLPARQIAPGEPELGVGMASEVQVNEVHLPRPKLQASWGPSYAQSLGGPDGFLLYQLGLQASAEYRLGNRTWLSGTANARVLDNYQNFKYDAESQLPRVRTDLRQYLTASRLTIPNLQLNHVADVGAGHYVSAYGGLLESMYAGVGAEWLYRPWQGKWAVGADINQVRQRNYKQDLLGQKDYEATTGHATLYWDTGWNDVRTKVSFGKYLAGDWGTTVDMQRVFQNGVAIGAWATKTNVSADQFGEGSFDKGIYVTIPFDLMLPKSAPGNANLIWNPLTRDGGARLDRKLSLFDLTNQRDSRAWLWRSVQSARNRSGTDMSYVLPAPGPSLGAQWLDGLLGVGSEVHAAGANPLLWAGAAVLGASLLDREADNWAKDHQSYDPGNRWKQFAKVSNGMPYAIAASVGALTTGIAGDGYAATATTSVLAAVSTLGLNAIAKFSVGRARPLEEQGVQSFQGFTSAASQSGFASNHVAAAFALVTPFAQQWDSPWLYALAATSALGRVQSREHFVSDTVAGGLLGYAIGSVYSSQQTSRNKPWAVTATPQSLQVSWTY